MTLQQRSSQTLHLRSRDTSGASVSYARPLQRSEPPVVLHLDRAKAANTRQALSSVAPSSSTAPAAASPQQALDSDSLLQGAKVVQIMHNGESYQLRATRHGKLILTK